MEWVEVMVKESDRFAEESRRSLRLGATLLGVAIAANGAALETSLLGFLLATLALGAVIVYANQVFTYVEMISGYRHHLEEVINGHYGWNLLSWERKAMPLRRPDWSPRLIGVFAVLLFNCKCWDKFLSRTPSHMEQYPFSWRQLSLNLRESTGEGQPNPWQHQPPMFRYGRAN